MTVEQKDRLLSEIPDFSRTHAKPAPGRYTRLRHLRELAGPAHAKDKGFLVKLRGYAAKFGKSLEEVAEHFDEYASNVRANHPWRTSK